MHYSIPMRLSLAGQSLKVNLDAWLERLALTQDEMGETSSKVRWKSGLLKHFALPKGTGEQVL